MFTDTRSLLSEHGGLIVVCFLFIFFSIFGQSVFFGVYLPAIQEDLNLTKTALGLIYAKATIASSIVIIFAGKGLDYYPLRNFVAVVLCGLALGCFVMASAQSTLMLLLAFFLLRQFGQGLLVLCSSASINRYLDKNRGKAVALTSLGSSLQLMIFPILALSLDGFVGWRTAWNYYGFFVLFVLLPGFWFYLKTHQTKTHAKWQQNVKAQSEDEQVKKRDQWTRKRVLRDWRFYGIVAIAMISPFVGTVIFFYQRELAESLSITPMAFAASFPFFTVSMIASSFISGAIIDKYGEKAALVSYPIIYSVGLFLMSAGSGLAVTYSGMVVLGLSTGIMSTIGGPLLAKYYGTKHLASIKSLLFSTSILASALSPFIFGFFMDQGYEITTLFSSVIYYSGVVWILAFPICRNVKVKQAAL